MAVSLPTPNFLESTKSSNGRFLYEYAGNLYWCCLAQLGDTFATHALQIWKSSNDGASWTRIVNDVDRAGFFFGACLGPGGILYFAVQPYPIAGNLRLYRYDLTSGANGAFLADDVAGPTGYAPSPVAVGAYASGKILIVFRKTGTGLGFVTWSAGVWSSFTLVSSDTIDADWMVKANLTERQHCFALKNNLGAGCQLYHFSVDGDGTVHTLQLLPTLNNAINQGTDTGQPAVSEDDSQICFPYVERSAGATLRALRAVPAADPAWTDEPVPTGSLPLLSSVNVFGWYIPYAVATPGRMWITFGVGTIGLTSLSDSQGYLYESHTDLLAGGWSVPTLVYAAPAGSIVISHWSIARDGGTLGHIVGTINLAQFFGVGTKYDALRVWWIGPADPVLYLACGNPPAGTVGVPYTHQIPYGPTSEFTTLTKSAGDFPGGLTMSPTGLISGVPDAVGTFAFTLTLTDTFGNSISVDCSIAIHAIGSSSSENIGF